MASFASPGLRRRLAALTAAARNKIRHRQDLRDKARAEASIAAALAGMPEIRAAPIEVIAAGGFSGARYYTGAGQVLSDLGDSPELRRADAAFIAADPELAARETEEAARLAEWVARYAKDGPPPEAGAAPFAWYAWSVAQKS